MKTALYLDYGVSLASACSEVKAHSIDRVLAWVGHDPARRTALGEHELYAYIKDNDLQVVGALCPSDNLAYLGNTRYGRRDAIKHFKQAVLSCAEHRVPLLIMDAAPTNPALIESLEEIAAYAKDNGIMLCIREAQGADTVGLLTAIPDLYYCLDSARSFALGQNPAERVTAAGERLAIVLLGDVVGSDDSIGERRLPGKVHDFAPLKDALKANGYRGDLVLTSQSSIDALREVIKAF